MKINIFGVILILVGGALILAIRGGEGWFDLLLRFWPAVFVIRGFNNWERDDQTKTFQVAQIFLGGVLIYDNFALLPATAEIYKWWPLLLIFFGLDMILRRERSFVSGGRMAAKAGGGMTGAQNMRFVREMPEIAERGRVDIDFNAGTLGVSGRTAQFMEGAISTSYGEPEIDFIPGRTTALRISQSGMPKILSGGGENRWNLSFTDSIPLEFYVEANAGVAELDLSLYRAEKVNIEGNAGKVTLRLGKLSGHCDVRVEVNAGRLFICPGGRRSESRVRQSFGRGAG